MSYEAWGEPDEYPECPSCEENLVTVDELALLVKRLVHALNKASPSNDLAAKAMDYLARNTTIDSSPLRADLDSPPLPLQGGEQTEWQRLGYASEVDYLRTKLDEAKACIKAHQTVKAEMEAAVSTQDAVTTGQILSLDRRCSAMSDDEALRFARSVLSLADRAVSPQGGEAKPYDEFAAIRLRAVCNMVGIGSAVPEDDAQLMECQFSVFGMIRGAIERERKAEPQNSRHFLTSEAVKNIEAKTGPLAAPAVGGETKGNLYVGLANGEEWAADASAKQILGEAKAVAPYCWKAAPLVPTSEMIAAGNRVKDGRNVDKIFCAMIGAAPATSQEQVEMPSALLDFIYSADLYAVLMDVQNGIESIALPSMANKCIRKLDKLKPALERPLDWDTKKKTVYFTTAAPVAQALPVAAEKDALDAMLSDHHSLRIAEAWLAGDQQLPGVGVGNQESVGGWLLRLIQTALQGSKP